MKDCSSIETFPVCPEKKPEIQFSNTTTIHTAGTMYVRKFTNTITTEAQTPTWLSYGRKAMLISFNVFIFLAAGDLHSSLNNSSWHTGGMHTKIEKQVS